MSQLRAIFRELETARLPPPLCVTDQTSSPMRDRSNRDSIAVSVFADISFQFNKSSEENPKNNLMMRRAGLSNPTSGMFLDPMNTYQLMACLRRYMRHRRCTVVHWQQLFKCSLSCFSLFVCFYLDFTSVANLCVQLAAFWMFYAKPSLSVNCNLFLRLRKFADVFFSKFLTL